ncbi:MAG: hypothetical protein WBG90_17830 [Saonia sp.]
MKTKKLNLYDFKAVGTQELLETKGGAQEIPSWSPHSTLSFGGKDGENGSSSGCAGDPNGFGGTFDANEVVVYGTRSNGTSQPEIGAWLNDTISGPTIRQGYPSTDPYADCPGCNMAQAFFGTDQRYNEYTGLIYTLGLTTRRHNCNN